jgi:hypothetical protein
MNKKLGVLTKKTYVVSLLLSTCTGNFLFGLVLKVVVLPVVCSTRRCTDYVAAHQSRLFRQEARTAQKGHCLNLTFFFLPALTPERQLSVL